MTLSDIDAVLKIEQASFPTPWPKEAFLYELTRPGRSVCRVAESTLPENDPFILGDIVVWLAGEVAHVATLAVHPDHRRGGIGACLLARGLLASMERGMSVAVLEVREHNQGAQALYRKFGFETAGVRTGYYADTGEDALVMALRPLSGDQLAEFAKCG